MMNQVASALKSDGLDELSPVNASRGQSPLEVLNEVSISPSHAVCWLGEIGSAPVFLKVTKRIESVASQIAFPKFFEQHSQVPLSEITDIVSMSFWDAPLYGVCRYSDKPCFFHVLYENDGHSRTRVYLLLELTAEQLRENAEYWKSLEAQDGAHELRSVQEYQSSRWKADLEAHVGPVSGEVIEFSIGQVIGWFIDKF